MKQPRVLTTDRVLIVIEQNILLHKAEYLDEDAVAKYRLAASFLPDNGRQNIGPRKALQDAFAEKYGVPVLTAVNIMDGYRIGEYLKIYGDWKRCDEMRVFLFEILKRMELPEELQPRQINRLMRVFVESPIVMELLIMYEAEDRWKNGEMLLTEILYGKGKLNCKGPASRLVEHSEL